MGKFGLSTATVPFSINYINHTTADAGKIYVFRFDGSLDPYIISNITLNDDKWHHIAFVKSGTTLTLYIDGVQNNTTTDNTTGTTTNTSALSVGSRGNNINFFKGEIDEVRIWTVGKTATQIADEMFCKTPNPTNLQAAYNFSNGVPHDNNALITQVQDASTNLNHGTLNNFTLIGDASNFVTGQVKYVKNNAAGSNNGSSWANAFIDLQSALTATTCNDLFEVYVAKSNASYKPAAPNGDVFTFFDIPSGMRIYGGFAGTETNINQRNMALIHTTYKTTLSGDLNGNDTPFNFTTNRTDNSQNVVEITGSNASLDGFTIRGAGNGFGVRINSGSTNTLIKHNKVIDNNYGIRVGANNNNTIANSIISGNQVDGLLTSNADALTINNSLIANNGRNGVNIDVFFGTRQTNISNSTIASNGDYGINILPFLGNTSNNTLKNTLIYGNALGGIFNDNTDGGTINNTITYSLVQGGLLSGTGNLNGNTVNPQFVSPLANTVRSDAGDYRLKWCSKAIAAGNKAGISPLDLDRNPRDFRSFVDMGAYEFLGNIPSQAAIGTITGTIDSPTFAGGAIQTITSTAKILAPAGAIDFKAPNSIILLPGFEAKGVGKYFKAEIGANVGCVN